MGKKVTPDSDLKAKARELKRKGMNAKEIRMYLKKFKEKLKNKKREDKRIELVRRGGESGEK